MPSMWPVPGENRAFSIISQQRGKTIRTKNRAIQIAGFAVEGSFYEGKSAVLSRFEGWW